jgi:hypothetical protein
MGGVSQGRPRWVKRALWAVLLAGGIGCVLFARAYRYESMVWFAGEALRAVGLASIRYQQENRCWPSSVEELIDARFIVLTDDGCAGLPDYAPRFALSDFVRRVNIQIPKAVSGLRVLQGGVVDQNDVPFWPFVYVGEAAGDRRLIQAQDAMSVLWLQAAEGEEPNHPYLRRRDGRPTGEGEG